MNVSSLDALMSSVANCLEGRSLQSIVDLRASPQAEERIAWLAERANEGQLTDDERKEYESCVLFSNFVGVLQSKARKKLRTA